MSNSFFVFLESNTTDYPDNQPNKFRVHLPKPLYFSGNWVCGVHSISYPFSWPSTIGTLDEQWMKIHFIDDNSKKNVLRVPVPAASHNSVEALKNYLATTLKHQSDAIGSVERPGAFIAPPSLLRSPPRAEKKIKRSANESKSPPPYEELRSPPPYLEEEQEKKEKSPSPELGSPPLYIEDENKDRTPSPTREEPTSPPPYLEEKSPEKPSTAPPPIEIVETSPPKPKKERKEEKEKQAQENVTQKAPTSVLSNVGVDKKEEKKEQENTTQKSTNVLSTIGLAKKEEKKDEQKTTQKPPSGVLSSIGLDKKDEKKDQDKSQKPTTILSTIGVEKKKEDKKEQDKTPQKPTSVLSTIGVEKKEDKKEQDKTPQKPTSVLSTIGLDKKKEQDKEKPKPTTPAPQKELKSPPRYNELPKQEKKDEKKEQAKTTPKPTPSNITSTVEVVRKEEKKVKENATQNTVGVESNKKESQKRPSSVLGTIGLESSRKEEKKDEKKTQKPPSGVLSAVGLTKKDEKKDNMTQTSPPASPTVLGAMGLKSTRKEQYNPRADKLFEVLFGKDYKLKETTPNLTLLKTIVDSIELHYLKDFARFKALLKHKNVLSLSFSPQLGYVLGFSDPNNVYNNEIAKYGCDLRGGFSSFAIYSKGLTENMIVGNSLSSLLRVVSISGAVPGEYNEKIYDSPIYARVLPREINEIEVELRTMDNGRLVPFAFGTVHIVLIFKKVINF
ncbi:hypothetical protein ACQ4LE_002768 [Meloidogyne hapla]